MATIGIPEYTCANTGQPHRRRIVKRCIKTGSNSNNNSYLVLCFQVEAELSLHGNIQFAM